MDVLYPLTLFGAIGGVTIYLCVRRLPDNERPWLGRWMTVALILRLTMAGVFASVPSTRIFHEDAEGYEWLGMATAAGWHGTGVALPPLGAQNYGFRMVAAAVYYVFGPYKPLVSCLNAVLGTLCVYLVYRLSRMYFHALVARRAVLLTVLIPSMILWSAIAIKDVIMTVLILVTLTSCVALKRKFSIGALVLLVGSIVAMQPIRFYMVYFLGISVVLALFLERGVRSFAGIYKQVATIGAFVIVLAAIGLSGRFQEGTSMMSFESVSRFRHGMAVTAESGFDANVDVSTPGSALAFLPIGLTELLLGPYPWQFTSLRASFAAPEMVYWWALFPSLLSGLWWSVRKRFAETSPLILFAGLMSCAYALMHGNVGSGFRQRAQIFVILFIFASFGQLKRRAQRLGIDPHLLLADAPAPAAPSPATSATTTAGPATSAATLPPRPRPEPAR